MQPKKSLGQHFLKCEWVVSTMIKTAEAGRDDIILEVGPGTGVLTRPLAEHAKKVIAVEKDELLAKNLDISLKQSGIANVAIVPGDILKILPRVVEIYKLSRSRSDRGSSTSFSKNTNETSGQTNSYKLVANIPYYLTSRLIRFLLDSETPPETIVLTVQKEVAERMVAAPPRMSLLSLSVRVFGEPKLIKTVPRECFSPKPRVESAIIKITPRASDFFAENRLEKEKFFSILKKAFNQKRKMIGGTLGLRDKKISSVIKEKRPEALSLEEWASIYHLLD